MKFGRRREKRSSSTQSTDAVLTEAQGEALAWRIVAAQRTQERDQAIAQRDGLAEALRDLVATINAADVALTLPSGDVVRRRLLDCAQVRVDADGSAEQ